LLDIGEKLTQCIHSKSSIWIKTRLFFSYKFSAICWQLSLPIFRERIVFAFKRGRVILRTDL